ncbi:AAA family ATPase [Demequina soli]|uniref:AAA family ATPase n=1 Tax=Demequina soli TaxID=1638987 RepID=UPI0007856F2D|nr:DEAD/DEAH box helicase family protein [Demequina soli]
MTSPFSPPLVEAGPAVHHAEAAQRNAAVADEAATELDAMLTGASDNKRLLLKAAAGAGKSYVLRRLVVEAASHAHVSRVAVAAFTNKQVLPLAEQLGEALGKDKVCLFVSKGKFDDVPVEVHAVATVVSKYADIPGSARVVVATCSKLGIQYGAKWLEKALGKGANGKTIFDVLFVDEAWQIPHHLFDEPSRLAPLWVGVGDVGQLPPLEVGENPWRGDDGFNPYRAWPTDYDDDAKTWTRELPAVWRPAAGHLELWRAFYPEWGSLDCVAAPGDRRLDLGSIAAPFDTLWAQVGTGVPTLLEIDGLPEPESPDVDLPLMEFIEAALDAFFAGGASLQAALYDATGAPTGASSRVAPGGDHSDPMATILATRNQAVDDAADAVDRLRERHGLTERDLVSSTVDSYQGQTNGITVALHPLNGASELDEFNSAFGRLAVTCTRATHGLLVVARPGLDELLDDAPARPGTPFGEPGNRQLPRQTHQRILATFARGRIAVAGEEE